MPGRLNYLALETQQPLFHHRPQLGCETAPQALPQGPLWARDLATTVRLVAAGYDDGLDIQASALQQVNDGNTYAC